MTYRRGDEPELDEHEDEGQEMPEADEGQMRAGMAASAFAAVRAEKKRDAEERARYSGRLRHQMKTLARDALGAGKSIAEWQHEIDCDFENALEIWCEVSKERADRIKFEEERGRRFRDDPAYQANLRDYEASLAREERGEQKPTTPSRRHPRGRPGQRVAREPSAFPVPADAEHTSGLIAAFDSKLGTLLGAHAFVLWCYMLRLASPSERHRRIEGLDQTALGEPIGLTKQQLRDALPCLIWTGMVEVVKPGKFGGGWAQGLTAVYSVPAVTTARLEAWRAKLEETTTWEKRIQ